MSGFAPDPKVYGKNVLPFSRRQRLSQPHGCENCGSTYDVQDYQCLPCRKITATQIRALHEADYTRYLCDESQAPA